MSCFLLICFEFTSVGCHWYGKLTFPAKVVLGRKRIELMKESASRVTETMQMCPVSIQELDSLRYCVILQILVINKKALKHVLYTSPERSKLSSSSHTFLSIFCIFSIIPFIYFLNIFFFCHHCSFTVHKLFPSSHPTNTCN